MQEGTSESTQLSEGDLALGKRELWSQAAPAPISPYDFCHLLVYTSVMLHIATWTVDLDSLPHAFTTCAL